MRLRRTLVPLALFALVLAACSSSTDALDPTVNGQEGPVRPPPADASLVPDDPAEHFDGGMVTLRDFAGTPMVVNFWASWCPPCLAEMPDFEAVSQLAGDRVTFVGINTQDTPERAAGMVDRTGVTYELVRDPNAVLSNAFGVFSMPSTYYVDAHGVIVGRHSGLLTRDALIADLREHLGVEVDADTG